MTQTVKSSSATPAKIGLFQLHTLTDLNIKALQGALPELIAHLRDETKSVTEKTEALHLFKNALRRQENFARGTSLSDADRNALTWLRDYADKRLKQLNAANAGEVTPSPSRPEKSSVHMENIIRRTAELFLSVQKTSDTTKRIRALEQHCDWLDEQDILARNAGQELSITIGEGKNQRTVTIDTLKQKTFGNIAAVIAAETKTSDNNDSVSVSAVTGWWEKIRGESNDIAAPAKTETRSPSLFRRIQSAFTSRRRDADAERLLKDAAPRPSAVRPSGVETAAAPITLAVAANRNSETPTPSALPTVAAESLAVPQRARPVASAPATPAIEFEPSPLRTPTTLPTLKRDRFAALKDSARGLWASATTALSGAAESLVTRGRDLLSSAQSKADPATTAIAQTSARIYTLTRGNPKTVAGIAAAGLFTAFVSTVTPDTRTVTADVPHSATAAATPASAPAFAKAASAPASAPAVAVAKAPPAPASAPAASSARSETKVAGINLNTPKISVPPGMLRLASYTPEHLDASVGRFNGLSVLQFFQNIIESESGGAHYVTLPNGKKIITTSDKGAEGSCQIMPGTQQEALNLAIRSGSLPRGTTIEQVKNDPIVNCAAGRAYLTSLKNTFGGDNVLATAAYNSGPCYIRGKLEGAVCKGQKITPIGDPRKGQITYHDFLANIYAETRVYVLKNLFLSGASAPIPAVRKQPVPPTGTAPLPLPAEAAASSPPAPAAAAAAASAPEPGLTT